MKRTRVQQASTRRTSGRWTAAAALALCALAATAFAPDVAAAVPSPPTATEISTAQNAKLGTILVSGGDTVYILKSSKTACTGKCLEARPPVLLPQGVTTATPGTGVDAAKLGTVAAANGALQVTYSGKPLYWFSKDKAPGQVHTNVKDKWGKWVTVVTVKSKSGSGTTNTTNSGTGGAGF